MVKSGALSVFPQLLHHPKQNIVKEAAWTISNIAAGNKDQIQALIDNGIIPPLLAVLKDVSTITRIRCKEGCEYNC